MTPTSIADLEKLAFVIRDCEAYKQQSGAHWKDGCLNLHCETLLSAAKELLHLKQQEAKPVVHYEELIASIINYANFNADCMEGEGLPAFKIYEDAMCWAIKTLKGIGVAYNPMTGKRGDVEMKGGAIVRSKDDLTSPEQNSPKDSVFVGAKSDTPRTDSEVDHPSNVQLDNECKNRLFGKQITEVVPADFARTLERELNTLNDQPEMPKIKWVKEFKETNHNQPKGK